MSRLVASAVEKSAHLRIDDFMRSVVNGRVEPWLPESSQQNEVIGGAVVAAAMQFTASGYTVVVDGNVFPDSLEELARACLHRDVPLHYAVLRCDLSTCFRRATSRDSESPDTLRFTDLHARFEDLGAHERYVVEASGTADEVASAALTAFRSGRLAVPVSTPGGAGQTL